MGLPDKGEKARKTKEMIVGLIIDKEKVEDLEDEMKKMKINTEKMEWKGGLLDSDDDSDPEDDAPSKNPLSVLAQGIIPKVSSTAKSEIVSKNELHPPALKFHPPKVKLSLYPNIKLLQYHFPM